MQNLSIMISNFSTTLVYNPVSYTIISSDTKLWADYDEDDYMIPTIPWAPHIKAVSIKLQPNESQEWTTVKSKKKRK